MTDCTRLADRTERTGTCEQVPAQPAIDLHPRQGLTARERIWGIARSERTAKSVSLVGDGGRLAASYIKGNRLFSNDGIFLNLRGISSTCRRMPLVMLCRNDISADFAEIVS